MTDFLNIVIPVYNEGKNFASLWTFLSCSINSEFVAYTVYDFEEDNTLPVARRIIEQGDNRLRLLRNTLGRGVVGAIRTGFQVVEDGPVLVVMADLSDDLQQVDKMLDLYRRGYHVIVGSRYMRGGAIIGGPFLKQTFSRLAGITLHWFRGIPTHDATNAFKIYDSAMLRTFRIESRGGFEINLEIIVKAFLAGYKIAEVPTVWRERTQGRSNFKLWSWLPRYVKWYAYAFRPKVKQSNWAMISSD